MDTLNKRSWWENFVLFGFIFVLGTLVVTLLMQLFYLLPAENLKANYDKSIEILEAEGVYANKYGNIFGTLSQLDNWTDKLMLLNAYSGNFDFYARYWGGYLIFLKPLLYVFDINGIRILNLVIQSLLVIAVAILMWKKCKRLILPYLLSLLAIVPFIIFQSLQFSTIFYTFNIAVLLILIFYKKLESSNSFVFFFFAVGMFTAFVDFLTYPIATLAVPLVLVFYLKGKKDETLKQKLLFFLKICVAWGIGYVGMIAVKWIVSSLILNKNVISDAIRQIGYRTGGQDTELGNVSWLKLHMAAFYNLAALRCIHNYILFGLIVISMIVTLIYYRKDIKFSKEYIVPLILVALIPVVWFTVISNHSFVHRWFTCRAYIGSIFAVLTLFVMLFENKKKTSEKVTEEAHEKTLEEKRR